MGTHPIFESDFDCLTDFQRQTMSVENGENAYRKRMPVGFEIATFQIPKDVAKTWNIFQKPFESTTDALEALMNKFKRGKIPYERSDEKIVCLKICTKEKDCIASSSSDNLEKRLRVVVHKLTTNTDTGFNLLEDIFECMVMNDSFQDRMAEEARRLELLGLRRIIPPSLNSEQPKTLPYHGFLRKELTDFLGNFRWQTNQRSKKPVIDPSLLLEGNQRRTRSQTTLMNKGKEADIKKSAKELFNDPKTKKNFEKIFQNKRRFDPISAEEIEHWQNIINKKARQTFSDPEFQKNLKLPTLRKSHLPSSEDILDILPLDLSIGN